MRRLLLVGVITAICTVTGVAAYRLSIDALALIIGVGLGFVLMMPVAGVLWWAVRNNARALQDQAGPTAPPSPPVIIVQPAHSLGAAPSQAQLPPPLPPAGYPVNLSTAATASRTWDLRVYGDEHMAKTEEQSQWES